MFFVAAGFPPEADAPMAHSLRSIRTLKGAATKTFYYPLLTSPYQGEELFHCPLDKGTALPPSPYIPPRRLNALQAPDRPSGCRGLPDGPVGHLGASVRLDAMLDLQNQTVFIVLSNSRT